MTTSARFDVQANQENLPSQREVEIEVERFAPGSL
jgi:hypothetical protein